MKSLYFLISLLFLIIFCQCSLNTDVVKNYNIEDKISRIDIKEREHGYNNFSTTVITNYDSLASFIEDINKQSYWNDKEAFLQTINESDFDLNIVNLVFFRHTENSGSIQLTVNKPYLSNGLITVEISRFVPSIGTDDMAYYCFAYTLKKDIDQLEFYIEGIGSKIININ